VGRPVVATSSTTWLVLFDSSLIPTVVMAQV
jgi:hypothetical protein